MLILTALMYGEYVSIGVQEYLSKLDTDKVII